MSDLRASLKKTESDKMNGLKILTTVKTVKNLRNKSILRSSNDPIPYTQKNIPTATTFGTARRNIMISNRYQNMPI